ncbi:hypothetical protein [Mesorhizobium sp. WSM4313]|uniref:hypothetical protein n=1 Tax=Mesorhizobium sp. WSM4313 TaxID=2029412 RepID=UPI000BB06362|nr:hypothetical protein [Mesorhizobium sp. WSM4313]PBB20532.1 hypothetical protein CK219_05155 [Mesorhizobium sp. WSM4313]
MTTDDVNRPEIIFLAVSDRRELRPWRKVESKFARSAWVEAEMTDHGFKKLRFWLAERKSITHQIVTQA